MKRILLSLLCLITLFGGEVIGKTVTDRITIDNFPKITGTAYTFDTYTSDNGITYALCGSKNGGLQMNKDAKKGGLAVTKNEKGLYVKSVEINFKTAQVIAFYSNSTPYEYASVDDFLATLAGIREADRAITASNTPYIVTKDILYWGIKPTSGAAVINEIIVTYEDPSATDEPQEYDAPFNGKVYTMTVGETMDLELGDAYPELFVFGTESDAIEIEEDYPYTIKAVKAGRAEVDVMWEDDNFEYGEAGFTVVVNPAETVDPTPGGETTYSYVLMTDVAQLGDEAEVIIVSGTKAMSTTQNTNNRGSVAIDIVDDTAYPGDQVALIKATKVSDGYTLYVTNGSSIGYLYAASGSSNYLKTRASNSDKNSVAAITITNGVTSVKFTGSNTKNDLRFNPSNNPPIFSCYGSGQTAVQLYVKTASTTPKLEAAGLEFSETAVEATIGQPFTAPTLTKATDAAVSYTSTNTAVATVDETSGDVTLLGAGETVITATTPQTETYLAGEAKYTLTVIDPNNVGYVLVTDVAQLKEEAEIIIVSGTNAMSTTQNNNNRSATGVKIEDNTILPGADVALITVTKVGDGYTLYANNGTAATNNTNAVGYLYPIEKNNYLRTNYQTVYNPVAWTIEIGTDNNATISYAVSASETRYLKYNSSSSLFSCYTSGQTAVQIYMKQGSASETAKQEAGLSYSDEYVKVPLNEPDLSNVLPSLDNPNNVSPIKYSSSNTSVATVDEDSGEVTLMDAGTTVISATFAGDDNFFEQTVSYTLEVEKNIAGTKVIIDWTSNNTDEVNPDGGSNGLAIGTVYSNDGIVTLETSFSAPEGKDGTAPRWWEKTDKTIEARFYNYGSLTISVSPKYKITGIEFFGGSMKNNMTAEIGEFHADDKYGLWEPSDPSAAYSLKRQLSAADEEVQSVTFNFTGQVSMTGTNVYYETSTGVDAIGNEENGEAVYYNLQGVRVNNPDHGIFVKVQNGKAKKVVK